MTLKNRNMGDDVSMVSNANGSSELSKNELVKLLAHGDSNLSLIAPEKFKSPIWERFRIVFYKGECRDLRPASPSSRRRERQSRLVIREWSFRDVIDDWRSVRLDQFFPSSFFSSHIQHISI